MKFFDIVSGILSVLFTILLIYILASLAIVAVRALWRGYRPGMLIDDIGIENGNGYVHNRGITEETKEKSNQLEAITAGKPIKPFSLVKEEIIKEFNPVPAYFERGFNSIPQEVELPFRRAWMRINAPENAGPNRAALLHNLDIFLKERSAEDMLVCPHGVLARLVSIFDLIDPDPIMSQSMKNVSSLVSIFEIVEEEQKKELEKEDAAVKLSFDKGEKTEMIEKMQERVRENVRARCSHINKKTLDKALDEILPK